MKNQEAPQPQFFVSHSAFFIESLPPRRLEERLEILHELAESLQGQLLRAIAPGLGGIGVHFDEKGISDLSMGIAVINAWNRLGAGLLPPLP